MIILGEKLPDLPVVDVDNVTLPYSAASLPPNQETFVRPIGIEQNNRAFRGGLSKLLEMADCMFEEAADECGATVVDHEWQLARAVRHDVRVHKLLPAGYSLVARVGIIDDVGFDEPTQSRIKEGLEDTPRKQIATDGQTQRFDSLLEVADEVDQKRAYKLGYMISIST